MHMLRAMCVCVEIYVCVLRAMCACVEINVCVC